MREKVFLGGSLESIFGLDLFAKVKMLQTLKMHRN